MDKEKIDSLVSQLKGVGLSDEEILDVFYAAFKAGKMDRKDLETLADSLGYELDDDFKEDSEKDPIESGDVSDDANPAGDLKSVAEDLKEIKPGESKEEFKEKIDEAKDDIEADKDDKKEEEDKSDDDDSDKDEDEWDEANKYFKI